LDSPTSVVQILQAYLKFSQALPFDDFLSAQPSWPRRLFQTLDPKFPIPPSTISPLAVSDGSVQLSQGTFGWILATTQPPHQLHYCSRPAFGASMDSYRAEAYGLFSFATLLDLMCQFFHSPCHAFQSGVTTSQSCKPSTPHYPSPSSVPK
jgi:hypothetical protein